MGRTGKSLLRISLGLFAIIGMGLLMSGCAGMGRAWDQAWYGTPPEVVSSVQFMNNTMLRELQEKYEAIEAAPVTDKDGKIVKEWAENRAKDLELVNAQIVRWQKLSKALADYVGCTLTEDPSLSQSEAYKRRQDFWEAIYKSLKDVKTQIPPR